MSENGAPTGRAMRPGRRWCGKKARASPPRRSAATAKSSRNRPTRSVKSGPSNGLAKAASDACNVRQASRSAADRLRAGMISKRHMIGPIAAVRCSQCRYYAEIIIVINSNSPYLVSY
jgi:hypothetical protein